MITWVVTLDTGRFGDWVVVQAPNEDAARKLLTRTQRSKIGSIRPSRPTAWWRAEYEENGSPLRRRRS